MLSLRMYILALSLIFATGSLTGSSLPTLRARTAAAAGVEYGNVSESTGDDEDV